MEDTEGVLSFDFEGGLDTASANPSASGPMISTDHHSVANHHHPTVGGPSPITDQIPGGHHNGRRSFRQTVCRHWLRSLCMKGDACGFLHQYDKSRMPVCRFFRLYGECREQDCVYKHTNEDIKECNM